MALQVCKECTTAYAPAARCPHCGHDQWVSEPEAGAPAEGGQEAGPETAGAGGTVTDDGKTDYNALAVKDLVELCKARGIAYSGTSGTLTKDELATRRKAQDGQEASPGGPE
jgi:hypothetical protein